MEASYLCEYEKFVDLFSEFLWNIDAHDKLVSRSLSFSVSTIGLLRFNNPKKHNHSVGKFEPASFQNKMSKIVIILQRRFMKSSHLKPLCELVLDIFEKVTKYIEHLSAQKDKCGYCPIQINDYFVASPNRVVIYNAINKLKKDGFPSVMKNYEILYFGLQSKAAFRHSYYLKTTSRR